MKKVKSNNILEIKDSIENDNYHYVTFYAIKWNISDLQNDIFEKGSVYIDESQYKLKHFLNHNFDKPIGKVIDVQTDDVGLLITSKLSNTDDGKRIYTLYKEGIVNEHSVTVIVKEQQKTSDGFNLIKKAQLIEVSSITSFAAQPLTEVVSLKNNSSLFDAINTDNNVNNNNNIDMNNNIEIKQKATEQEVAVIMDAIKPLQDTVSSLQDSIANLQSTVNSLVENGTDSTDGTDETLMLSKSVKNFVKNSNILKEKGIKRFKVNDFIKQKNVTLTGNINNPSYRGLRNTRGYFDDLIYKFNVIEVDRIDVGYTIVNTITFPTNLGTNCYVSNETDIQWTRYTSTLKRATNWTDYCEDVFLSMGMEAAIEKIGSILNGQVHRTLANDIWTTVNTNGTNATTTPSWTALNNQITECTIFDLLTIHSGDMVQTSNGVIGGANVIMVLNPVDFTRLKTSKTVANYTILTDQQLNDMGIYQSSAVPIGSYMVVSTDQLDYYLYDSGEINIIPSPTRPQDGIYRMYMTMRGLLTLHSENSNAAIYGNIAAAIANYSV